MGEVSSETIIYPQPIINSIDTSNILINQQYMIYYSSYSNGAGPTINVNDTIGIYSGRKINYTLKFKDNPNEKNYYRLVVLSKEFYTQTDSVTQVQTQSEVDNYSFDFTDVVSGNNSNNDPLSLVGGSNLNAMYNVFTDDLFNGKTYSLTFSTYQYSYIYRPKYKYEQKNLEKTIVSVYLQSISKDYYLYLKSRVASGGDNFFSEPVQVYNNIAGGIGIFGSYTSSNVVSFDL